MSAYITRATGCAVSAAASGSSGGLSAALDIFPDSVKESVVSNKPEDWTTRLSALMIELEEVRARATVEAMQAATQLLINFVALSPFANPELLPPFQRFITRRDPRADPRYPISRQAIPPQQPVYLKAVPRTPPRAMPAYTPPPRTTPPRATPQRNPNGTWRRDDLPYS